MMDFISQHDPEVGAAVRAEFQRQCDNIELIASENIVSETVLAAAGTVLTNKYAEGYSRQAVLRRMPVCGHRGKPGHRAGLQAVRARNLPTCSPTPVPRPTMPSTWPCASRGTRCWAWIWTTAAI